MKFIIGIFLLQIAISGTAQQRRYSGPDGKLELRLEVQSGRPLYSARYEGKLMIDKAPLGLKTTMGDFSEQLTLVKDSSRQIDTHYTLEHSKQAEVHYQALELKLTFLNAEKQQFDILFRIGNHDLAYCYQIPRQSGRTSLAVTEEVSGFRFPSATTTFLTPQSDAMIGWKRTKPSYEEPYQADQPMDQPSKYGKGYTFPALFRIGTDGWVLVSETGVDSRYCGSRLSEYQSDGLYRIAFPMAAENDGNGTVAPAFALPGRTPWRTLTISNSLGPIVETTVAWDLVEPLYKSRYTYAGGKGVWSWILWQDGSINYEDQLRYIDLAVAMGYDYILIDNWWDTRIGKERMSSLIQEAQRKGVDVFLWYSSSGYWNDIEQGPVNRMDNPIIRKKEMRWLQSMGVKGIKVDFFGGDKQETIRLYEAILSDADDHGLMVVFHGATLPRGWERMYPNFMGSEAVLASENMVFTQEACDREAFNACLHPFIRNTAGSMEFGGSFLNKRLNKGNNGGSIRRTTDVFELATAVLFQNPVQFFALAPNNLADAPADCLNFMRQVPVSWEETKFISGYPGRYVVLARRHGQQWYLAGINATTAPIPLALDLAFLQGQELLQMTDHPQLSVKRLPAANRNKLQVILQPQGGFLIYPDSSENNPQK
ncbi:glycoside hydrolase family 97 protein [Niabella terrae]